MCVCVCGVAGQPLVSVTVDTIGVLRGSLMQPCLCCLLLACIHYMLLLQASQSFLMRARCSRLSSWR